MPSVDLQRISVVVGFDCSSQSDCNRYKDTNSLSILNVLKEMQYYITASDLKTFSLNFSSSSFVIRVNLLHP